MLAAANIQLTSRICLALAIVVLTVAPAAASRPVPKDIVGCVTNGAFISSDGYHIRPMKRLGEDIDLTPLEGRRVLIKGSLLPGDAFILKSRPRDLGPCR